MRQYFLQLTGGKAPGPFDVYLSGSSGETLYQSNVSLIQLQAGMSVEVPDNVPSSSIVVYNSAYGCANEVQVILPTPPISITPTPTITPSITPTLSVLPSITPTVTVTLSITPTATVSITPSISITPTRTITPSITVTPSITPSITPTITPSPSGFTCSNYEITNNGGTSILWSGESCIGGTPVGGTVTGGGTTVYTGCIRDSSFAYGDNGSVVVSPTPC
jgi:hypothetical protein